jgi:hypothetical protein
VGTNKHFSEEATRSRERRLIYAKITAGRMVAQFAPRSNDSTEPCLGINLYEAARPAMSQGMKDVNLAAFILIAVKQLLVLIRMWTLRDKPRFRKVRPFELNVVLMLGFGLYQFAAFMPYYVALPCALVVVCYVFALSWFGASVIVQGLVLALEGNYAKLASMEATGRDRQRSEAISETTVESAAFSYLKRIGLLTRLLTGCLRVDQLSMVEIVATKKSYALLVLLLLLPSALTCILLIALTPAYQSCYECDIFLELPIGVAVFLIVYITAALYISYEAYSVTGFDDKGFVLEMVCMAGLLAPLALVVWILMILDPGEVQYNNHFNWSFLFVFTAQVWLTISYFYQFDVQWRGDRSADKLQIGPMDTMLASDPLLKKEFFDFAARHFVTESVNFLEDIKTYKHFFFEKGETWRLAKFKYLVQTYIVSGSRMEVNISYDMKMQILGLHDKKAKEQRNQNLDE